MKIVAIAQFYNEVDTGFLEQFIKYHKSLFDEVIVFDDGSTDGTADCCEKNNFHVIRSNKNNFLNEISHKSELLKAADGVAAEFIVSLDADEICNVSRKDLERICLKMVSSGHDGLKANFINLWRSNRFKRTDSLFDDMKPVKVWKHLNGVVPFERLDPGLHQRLYPDYVKQISFEEDLLFLHTGFCSKEHIMEKFLRYRKLGQQGFNLMRFIDERNLTTVKVDDKCFPDDWPDDVSSPSPISAEDYFSDIEVIRDKINIPKVSVFSLIYKDIGWLEFVYNQFLANTDIRDIEFYFIANDASDEVIAYMRDNFIPFFEFTPTDSQRQEHYINNVYRAYNFGVEKAKAEKVILLNSDMAFSEGWLEALLRAHSDDNCVSSRLIEQGKLATGRHGIEKNFGDNWKNFDAAAFENYASMIAVDQIHDGGLYMPLLISKKWFLKVGGYPEGNIVQGSDPLENRVAPVGGPIVSGDTAFIEKLNSVGVKHVTSFNSIVYHFQEGEKRTNDSDITHLIDNSKIVIANNTLNGINGERVLWNQLLEFPNTVGLDYAVVDGKSPHSFKIHLHKQSTRVSFVFQNASFIPRVLPETYTMLYLQDNLRKMGRFSQLQEENLERSQAFVTNVANTAASYPEFDFEICPIGVDELLFVPKQKKKLRDKYCIEQHAIVGIFVGSLDDTKGWSEVEDIIKAERALKWIVVSKYENSYDDENVYFFKNQNQEALSELLNCADFFILGSPVETQCLAAIEAALCNLPIVMKPVGVFANFTDLEKQMVGVIGNNLHRGVLEVLQKLDEFSPREVMLSKGLSETAAKAKWWNLFSRHKMLALNAEYRQAKAVKSFDNTASRLKNKLDIFFRFRILRPIIKRDTLYTVAEVSVYLKSKMPRFLFNLIRAAWRIFR